MQPTKGLKIFIPILVILSIGLFILLLSKGSTDLRGPFIILFGAIIGGIYYLFSKVDFSNNESAQALRNFVVNDLPAPMTDKGRDHYIKNVRIPITYYTIYTFVGIGLIWVVYYFFIR